MYNDFSNYVKYYPEAALLYIFVKHKFQAFDQKLKVILLRNLKFQHVYLGQMNLKIKYFQKEIRLINDIWYCWVVFSKQFLLRSNLQFHRYELSLLRHRYVDFIFPCLLIFFLRFSVPTFFFIKIYHSEKSEQIHSCKKNRLKECFLEYNYLLGFNLKLVLKHTMKNFEIINIYVKSLVRKK